jgi:general secretion pathway protein K
MSTSTPSNNGAALPSLPNPRRGGALLAVLWLSAALAAIAFSVAATVRAEVDRASTLLDSTRARYLAAGAVERALVYILRGPMRASPDGRQAAFAPESPVLPMSFATGEAVVEIIPETARLSLNQGKPEDFTRLLGAIGVELSQAREIALAIVDWRSPAPGGVGLFDAFYLSRTPSFRARHASFEEVEEVLFVKGMTPEIFYGTWRPTPDGRLARTSAFRDCVSVYGAVDQFDINSSDPALLVSIGIPPQVVDQIVQARRLQPFTTRAQLAGVQAIAGPAGSRLTLGGNTIYTLRATARPRLPSGALSEVARSVSATVKFMNPMLYPGAPPVRTLRWRDEAIAEGDLWRP